MKQSVHAPRPGFFGPLCNGKGYVSPYKIAKPNEAFDCKLCLRLSAKADRLREADPYQPLSEEAKAYVGSRHGSTRRICECPGGTTDVALWAAGVTVPSYKQIFALLMTTEALTLEDFGYVRLPDGRVARLLKTEGNAP